VSLPRLVCLKIGNFRPEHIELFNIQHLFASVQQNLDTLRKHQFVHVLPHSNSKTRLVASAVYL